MSITSYTDTLLTPVYTAFGVTVTMVLSDDTIIELTGIDKSGGVEVASSSVDIPTVKPAVVIRMDELDGKGKTPEDLIDAIITMNGAAWRIVTYFPKPSPNGEMDGELYIILEEAPD